MVVFLGLRKEHTLFSVAMMKIQGKAKCDSLWWGLGSATCSTQVCSTDSLSLTPFLSYYFLPLFQIVSSILLLLILPHSSMSLNGVIPLTAFRCPPRRSWSAMWWRRSPLAAGTRSPWWVSAWWAWPPPSASCSRWDGKREEAGGGVKWWSAVVLAK